MLNHDNHPSQIWKFCYLYYFSDICEQKLNAQSSTLVMLHLKNPDYEIQILCKLGSIYFAI